MRQKIKRNEIDDQINTINKDIASALATIMTRKGTNVMALAEVAEISSSNLYSILRGETTPSLYTLYKLCQGLEISMNEFMLEVDFPGTDNKTWYNISNIFHIIGELSRHNKRILLEIAEILLKNQNS